MDQMCFMTAKILQIPVGAKGSIGEEQFPLRNVMCMQRLESEGCGLKSQCNQRKPTWSLLSMDAQSMEAPVYLAQNSYKPSNTGQSSPTLKWFRLLVKPWMKIKWFRITREH